LSASPSVSSSITGKGHGRLKSVLQPKGGLGSLLGSELETAHAGAYRDRSTSIERNAFVSQDVFGINFNVHGRQGEEVDFVGIYDGHGPNGENVARYSALKLSHFVMNAYNHSKLPFEQAIQAGCIRMDAQMRKESALMDGK